MHLNLYELLLPTFKWPKEKTIRVFETFAGIGAQAKGFENLQINHEVTGISEIDKDAILAYAAIHCDLNRIMQSYSFPEKEEMVAYLQKLDVGYDFKNQRHTITEKTGIDKVKRYYLANVLSKNYGNISKIHMSDLPEIDFLTYSFPCQDLSRAGAMRGMDKESHTRSGLLWEIERILEEGYAMNRLPKILMMENVPEVIGTTNLKNFRKWYAKLEELGYQSYYKILDASDFGVPQHRERCFMISIYGAYHYDFPMPVPLTISLQDVMENKADKSDFISHKDMLKMISVHDETMKLPDCYVPQNIEHQRFNFMKCINGKNIHGKRVSQTNRIFDSRGISATLTCGYTGYYLVDSSQYPDEDIGDRARIGDQLVRRLTVKEAYRLMGFTDEDVEKVISAGVSRHQMYRQAGNSIVVNVLMAIFNQLF